MKTDKDMSLAPAGTLDSKPGGTRVGTSGARRLLHLVIGHDWRLEREAGKFGELVFRCRCGAEKTLERADLTGPSKWSGGRGGGVRG